MKTAAPVHTTTIEATEPVPPEVPVGADISLQVSVTCSEGCRLHDWPVSLTAPEGDVTMVPSTNLDAETGASRWVGFTAPLRVGDYAWTLVCPAHKADGISHAESTLPICFKTKPHDSSLAVWAIPPSVVTGERFEIMVGAKSSADCVLQGKAIEICDQDGAVAARGVLGDAPFPGTSALYWARVELAAPPQDGICSWSVKFEAAGLELAHNGASTGFSFVVVRPPEHTVTVRVVEKDAGAPLDAVEVRLGAYRGTTDQAGQAVIKAAKGSFELHLWKVGYEAPPQTVDVKDDVVVQVEAVVVPEEDPDSAWMM